MDYRFDASEVRVIDGDTIEATIDMGFRIQRKDMGLAVAYDGGKR